MHPEISTATLQEIDTADWKEIAVEYGREILAVRVPPNCDILSMKEIPFLADPRAAFEEALSHPIGSPPLEEIIRAKGKPAAELRAAVTVSDITRPVPYRGEGGLLRPLLNRLEAAGIPRKNIVIVIGNGMHRPSTAAERIEMFGEEILRDYPVIDHDCEDQASLTFIGKSGDRRGCLRQQRLLPGRSEDRHGARREPLHGGALRRAEVDLPGTGRQDGPSRSSTAPPFWNPRWRRTSSSRGIPATKSPWRSPGRSGWISS